MRFHSMKADDRLQRYRGHVRPPAFGGPVVRDAEHDGRDLPVGDDLLSGRARRLAGAIAGLAGSKN